MEEKEKLFKTTMAKTFIEITKTNSYGEQGKALIRLSDIIGIKEMHVEPTRTYDIDGNVVSETPKPKDFRIFVGGGWYSREQFHVSESEYNRIVKELTEE